LNFFSRSGAAVSLPNASHLFVQNGHRVTSQRDDGIGCTAFAFVGEVFINGPVDQLLCLGDGGLLLGWRGHFDGF
jgi:hypothetical protein